MGRAWPWKPHLDAGQPALPAPGLSPLPEGRLFLRPAEPPAIPDPQPDEHPTQGAHHEGPLKRPPHRVLDFLHEEHGGRPISRNNDGANDIPVSGAVERRKPAGGRLLRLGRRKRIEPFLARSSDFHPVGSWNDRRPAAEEAGTDFALSGRHQCRNRICPGLCSSWLRWRFRSLASAVVDMACWCPRRPRRSSRVRQRLRSRKLPACAAPPTRAPGPSVPRNRRTRSSRSRCGSGTRAAKRSDCSPRTSSSSGKADKNIGRFPVLPLDGESLPRLNPVYASTKFYVAPRSATPIRRSSPGRLASSVTTPCTIASSVAGASSARQSRWSGWPFLMVSWTTAA